MCSSDLGKLTEADYTTLSNLYWATNPDDFAAGQEYNAHTSPRLSWMRANWDVNTTTTYLAVENNQIVEKSIGERVGKEFNLEVNLIM